MIVFAFRYSSCIHEEGMVTISLHKTKKGAEKAKRKHKAVEKKKWKEFYSSSPHFKEHPEYFKFGEHEKWDVKEIEVQE